MKNLKNNKIYNIARFPILLSAIVSFIASTVHIIQPNIFSRFYLISSNIVWGFVHKGYEEYLLNERISAFISLIVCCLLISSIYVMLYFLSKKYLGCFIVTLVYCALDTALYIVDARVLYSRTDLIIGLIIRAVFLVVFAIGLYYGFLGRSIERSETAYPDTKFTSKSYSKELAQVERKITIKREKGMLDGYIYLQCFLDYNSVCYLKNGDIQEITIDGNAHIFTIVSHYEKIKTKRIKISDGSENESYTISVKRKKLIFPSVQVKKNIL